MQVDFYSFSVPTYMMTLSVHCDPEYKEIMDLNKIKIDDGRLYFNEIKIYNDRANNQKRVFYAVTRDLTHSYNLIASLKTKEDVQQFLATQETHMNLTVDHIAKVANAPKESIEATWPLVLKRLEKYEINTPLVQLTAAATIIVETGGFLPVLSNLADPLTNSEVFKKQFKHGLFIGCGLITDTNLDNWSTDGVPPEIQLDPEVSAEALASYFKENNVHHFAHLGDFARVRRIIGGPAPLFMKEFLILIGKLSLISGIDAEDI